MSLRSQRTRPRRAIGKWPVFGPRVGHHRPLIGPGEHRAQAAPEGLDSAQLNALRQLGYLGGAGSASVPRGPAAPAECKHQPCSCRVAAGEDYCSEACGEAAKAGSDTCGCGHAECRGS